MATRVFHGIKSFNNFGRVLGKDHACQVSLNMAKRYWRRSHLNEKVNAQTDGLPTVPQKLTLPLCDR
jgi:hypothetical protein